MATRTNVGARPQIRQQGASGHQTVTWRDPRTGVRYDVTFDARHHDITVYARKRSGKDLYGARWPVVSGGRLPQGVIDRLGPENTRRLMDALAPRRNPSDLDVRERWDRCVRDVAARGGAYNPNAICAAGFRRAYGPQFQRIAAQGRSAAAAARHARGEVRGRASGRLERRPASRLRPTAVQRRGELGRVQRAQRAAARATGTGLRAVANPVEEVLQSHMFAPGHAAVEWVDARNGRWADAAEFDNAMRRPPRRPGPVLVAPGAQLVVMWGEGTPSLQYARVLFIRHHHHWKLLQGTSAPVTAHLEHGKPVMHGRLPPQDAMAMALLTKYAAAQIAQGLGRQRPHGGG